MSKVKYYYDSETLSYRKIEPKRGKKIGLSLLFALGVLVTAFLLLIVFLNIPNLETPKEKAYKRELENMKLQYAMLDRKTNQAISVLEELEERDDNI